MVLTLLQRSLRKQGLKRPIHAFAHDLLVFRLQRSLGKQGLKRDCVVVSVQKNYPILLQESLRKQGLKHQTF